LTSTHSSRDWAESVVRRVSSRPCRIMAASP
jgi:hypothetical protein